MTDQEHRIAGTRSSTLALVSTVAASAGLVAAAFLTVSHAGCDTPGYLVTRPDGVVQVVDGCLSSADVVIPAHPSEPAEAPLPPQPGVRP
ncbi:MAG: hypothetical protein ABI251_15565 [Mycobacteriaceae bacterium]